MFYQAGLTTEAARASGDISRACRESEPNKTIKSPPSLDHRYVHEDVGYGLVPFAELGRLAGVKTPTIDALVQLAGLSVGVDYVRDGLTLERLGLAGKSPVRSEKIRRRRRLIQGTSMEHEVLGKLRSAMRKAGYDALVAFSQDNVTYTTGFLVPSHASNRFRRTITVLAGDEFASQIVVNVEENLAKQRSRFADIRSYNQFTQDPADILADTLIEAGAGLGRIAIELDYMPAQDYIRLRERLPAATLVPCRDLYFNARMIKTDQEIAVLTEVGRLTDRVIGEVLHQIKPGMTEKAIAQTIGGMMLDGGCDGLKCQVGSGVRSGITNCTPTDKAGRKRRHRAGRDPWRYEAVPL